MSHTPPAPAQQADLIDLVVGVSPDARLDRLRRDRPEQRHHTQRAYEALFQPLELSLAHVDLLSRTAVATFVAAVHGYRPLTDHYAALLRRESADAEVVSAVLALARDAATTGPYGEYPTAALALESLDGVRLRIEPRERAVLGDRLAAALEHAHLLTFRPREANHQHLQHLLDAGWDTTGVVTLSQAIAFLSYQIRLAHGLSVLAQTVEGRSAQDPSGGEAARADDAAGAATAGDGSEHAGRSTAPGAAGGSGEAVTTYDDDRLPQHFTREALGWVPWLTPLAVDELTERHYDGLVQRSRATFPYFALLARDPEVLGARTRADLDIFTNTTGGLPRAERELAAAVASRLNGCIFCASVHARLAVTEDPATTADVDAILADGVDAATDPRRRAIAEAAVALAATPATFDGGHTQRLREAGLDDAAIADVIGAASFFSWANRLMLSLGQPEVPRRKARP